MKAGLVKKLSVVLAAALVLPLAFSGCSGGSSPAASTAAANSAAASAAPASGGGKQVKVDLLVKQLDSDFWVDLQTAAADQCKEYGWTMKTLCPTTDNSNEQQIQLLEQSLLNPPDIYLLAPADSKGIAPAIQKINQAGIPIINIQTPIVGNGLDVKTFIGVDTYKLSEMGAQAIVKKRPDAKNVIILEGITGSQTTEDIKNAAVEVFTKAGVRILALQTANGLRQDGMTVTQNLLQKFPNVDIIYAGNAQMALGAVEAVRQAGRTGISIATINTSKEITQAIMDGTITMTVDDVPWKISQDGVVQAKNLLDGKTLAPKILETVQIESKDSNLDYYKNKYGLK